jgi:hypothetical protein
LDFSPGARHRLKAKVPRGRSPRLTPAEAPLAADHVRLRDERPRNCQSAWTFEPVSAPIRRLCCWFLVYRRVNFRRRFTLERPFEQTNRGRGGSGILEEYWIPTSFGNVGVQYPHSAYSPPEVCNRSFIIDVPAQAVPLTGKRRNDSLSCRTRLEPRSPSMSCPSECPPT